jgi:hypothetical protein
LKEYFVVPLEQNSQRIFIALTEAIPQDIVAMSLQSDLVGRGKFIA